MEVVVGGGWWQWRPVTCSVAISSRSFCSSIRSLKSVRSWQIRMSVCVPVSSGAYAVDTHTVRSSITGLPTLSGTARRRRKRTSTRRSHVRSAEWSTSFEDESAQSVVQNPGSASAGIPKSASNDGVACVSRALRTPSAVHAGSSSSRTTSATRCSASDPFCIWASRRCCSVTSKSWTIASPFEYLVPRTEKERPSAVQVDVNVPLASSSRKSLSSCSGLLTERCREGMVKEVRWRWRWWGWQGWR